MERASSVRRALRRSILLLGIGLALAYLDSAACNLGRLAAELIRVDRCLDAGGCWNSGTSRCELSSQEACDAR